jgi:hypothetical protein
MNDSLRQRLVVASVLMSAGLHCTVTVDDIPCARNGNCPTSHPYCAGGQCTRDPPSFGLPNTGVGGGGNTDGGSSGNSLGDQCSASAQCASGHCVDSVCCDSACNEKVCQRCDDSSAGGKGHCGFALPGSDLDQECSPPRATCSGKCKVKVTSSACSGNGYACTSTDEFVNIPSAEVCVGDGGVPVSKTAYCNWGSDCAEGKCRATQWWTGCNGQGSCYPSEDNTDAFKEAVYASSGASLTGSCATNSNTRCDNNKQCSQDDLYTAHFCDGAGACNVPTGATNCGSYTCDATLLQCKTQCSSNADCAQGLLCSTPTCHVSWEWVRWDVTKPRSYARTTDTVLDGQTGLMWQRDYATDQSWDGANGYCETLTAGNFSDWRLPTRIELLSILIPELNPPIDSRFLMPATAGRFWTSTRYAGGSGTWYVDFAYKSLKSEYEVMTTPLSVRCVR